METVARLRARGVRILPGGDYGFPFTPHGTYARDLWLFVKILGFSAMDTRVAADLLLVDGDPLANIEVLQDRGSLRMIMKDGALHKAPAAR